MQQELNQTYDAYSAKYGLINDRANRLAFSDDSSYYLLCSLEILAEEHRLKGKADMFTKRTIRHQLHETSVPEYKGKTKELWQRLVSNPDYHLIAAEEDGKIVSTCTCIIVPNMTHGPRPYAFVENVVTDSGYRGRGLATACLERAKEIAKAENCYRLILMTGSKLDSTLNCYLKAGYDYKEKTCIIQYLY